MVSLDLQCVSVFSIVGECMLRDEHWRAFGYRKRPRRGKFFDVFVDSNELEQEKVLVREFWAVALGRVFYWALKVPTEKKTPLYVGGLHFECVQCGACYPM